MATTYVTRHPLNVSLKITDNLTYLLRVTYVNKQELDIIAINTEINSLEDYPAVIEITVQARDELQYENCVNSSDLTKKIILTAWVKAAGR